MLKIAQLNASSCKTYILTSGSQSLILDPLKENIPMYLAYMAYNQSRLHYIVDSHSHADHMSAAFKLRELTGAKYVMSSMAPAPKVDLHVNHGDVLSLGDSKISVLHTPGHTKDSISLYTGQHVFTGDTLFIAGCGRTDFAGGDPKESYDSIYNHLFTLPDDTVVYPSHDYRFNESSTIGIEKTTNLRLAGKSKEQFCEIMDNLGLPLPEKIMEALQINTSDIEEKRLNLPTYSDLLKVKTISSINGLTVPFTIVDVREPTEFENFSIDNSINIPLKHLVERMSLIESRKKELVVCVCRVGMRSATAASILAAYGFENVVNLAGGLFAINPKI